MSAPHDPPSGYRLAPSSRPLLSYVALDQTSNLWVRFAPPLAVINGVMLIPIYKRLAAVTAARTIAFLTGALPEIR